MPQAPPLLIGLFTLIWIAAGIGITLWAWGDWTTFWQSPARWGSVLAFVVYSVGVAVSRTSGWSSGRKEDEQNRWIVPPLTFLGVMLVWLPPFCDRRGIWLLDGDAVRYSGLALSWIGTVMRLHAMFVLRHRFSALVAIQQHHDLVTTGIYGVIRHPAYLGGLGILLGWALTFRSLIGSLLVVGMHLLLVVRMNAEEALLVSHFGEEYESYRRRTKRLIPFLY